MHAKAHLLKGVDDVTTREGEVLESPARLRYSVGSAMGVPAKAKSLGNVSIGVMAVLQAVMPVFSRISAAYLACKRCMPEESRVTAIPRK
jgi:hypothetical protein